MEQWVSLTAFPSRTSYFVYHNRTAFVGSSVCCTTWADWLKKGHVFSSKSLWNEIAAMKVCEMVESYLWIRFTSVKVQYFSALLSFRISEFPRNMVCWKVMPHNFFCMDIGLHISVKPKQLAFLNYMVQLYTVISPHTHLHGLHTFSNVQVLCKFVMMELCILMMEP